MSCATGTRSPPPPSSVSFETDPLELQVERLVTLAPGESADIPFDVQLADAGSVATYDTLHGNQQHTSTAFALSGPGVYTIRLSYRYWGADGGKSGVVRTLLVSNDVTFEVAAAPAASARKASEPGGIKIVGKDPFPAKVAAAIDKLRETATGRAVIDRLSASSHTHTITETHVPQGSDNVPDDEKKAKDPESGGTGSTTKWDPDNATKYPGDVERDPAAALLHELQHALDANDGTLDRTDESGIPKAERKAVKTENDYREEQGLPKRTKYGSPSLLAKIRVESPLDGFVYKVGKILNFRYDCPHAASCVGTTPSGATPVPKEPGPGSLSVTASDHEGNTRTVDLAFNLVYGFVGFKSPVTGTSSGQLNVAKASSLVKVGFVLGGDFGLGILAPGSPTSEPIDCPRAPTHDVKVATATEGGLRYPGPYEYDWQTDASWAGTCRQFVLVLNDGTERKYTADFQFK